MQSKCIIDGTLGLAPAAGPDTMESYVAPWSNSSLPFIRFWTQWSALQLSLPYLPTLALNHHKCLT